MSKANTTDMEYQTAFWESILINEGMPDTLADIRDDFDSLSLVEAELEEQQIATRFGDASKDGAGLVNTGGVCELVAELFDGEDSRYESN